MRKRGGTMGKESDAPITPNPSSSASQRPPLTPRRAGGGTSLKETKSDKKGRLGGWNSFRGWHSFRNPPPPSSSSVSSSSGKKTHPHAVHIDSNQGIFPGFPNVSLNFFRRECPGELHLENAEVHNDKYNYALLLALYTLQGIPMGLSASIPFLIQQKVKQMSVAAAAAGGGVAASASASAAGNTAAAATAASQAASKMAYNAQAVFALCSWPFSLKLLWAPIVDAVYLRRFGRRKSWLVPVQLLAGMIMIGGSDYVETQLGLGNLAPAAAAVNSATAEARKLLDQTQPPSPASDPAFDIKGVTAFFFALYFLMATQDIAVDGWALTMLSKKNRGKGPICNSIGQNLGYFLSFVGFLALNDAESSEKLWRPLFRLPSRPGEGLVSLGGFIRFMGFFMVAVTTVVAIFKREVGTPPLSTTTATLLSSKSTLSTSTSNLNDDDTADEDDDEELDASKIGLAETYHRLWAVCQLPAVRWLFLILMTYRLPTSLSDNVKFLKAVEFGLSKQTTALLSPLVILPLGIAVPIVAAKIWKGHPLKQFTTAYKLRVTIVALFDVLMLFAVRSLRFSTEVWAKCVFWSTIVGSTALQAIMSSLQFNAQLTFFASRVDPAIGGTYMTLLNTAANLGGTWPSSAVMYLVGLLTVPPSCRMGEDGVEVCSGGRDAYFPLQLAFSCLGLLWLVLLGGRVKHVANLPEEAWRTHLDDNGSETSEIENGGKKASKEARQAKARDKRKAV